MGIDPISLTVMALAASAARSGYEAYAGRKEQKAQQAEAKNAAVKAEAQSTREINAANAKAPDVGALLSGNQQAAAAGGSGTLLTGPRGVDPDLLKLGRTTLLGG